MTYCINDPNDSLSLYGPGSYDDLDKNRNNSKFYVKVEKCHNSSVPTKPNQCSSKKEIDDWLDGK